MMQRTVKIGASRYSGRALLMALMAQRNLEYFERNGFALGSGAIGETKITAVDADGHELYRVSPPERANAVLVQPPSGDLRLIAVV